MNKYQKDHIIVIGAGDHLFSNLAGAINELEEKGLADLLFTVDVNERALVPDKNYINNKPHLIRAGTEHLDKIFPKHTKKEDPIIIAHINNLHIRDQLSLTLTGHKRILIEKPYTISTEGLGNLEVLLDIGSSNVALLEYGLHMKSSGLLLLAGLLKKNSFYLTEKDLIIPKTNASLEELSGILPDLIGTPEAILVHYLEGEGKTGTLEHRGPGLYLRSMGGGMIQDLFAHSMTPILALENYLGKINPDFDNGKVRIAVANELEKMVYERHKDVSPLDIGESYSEIDMKTSQDIPIKVRLGKYTPFNSNDRKIIIRGDKGDLVYDLSNPGAYLLKGKNKEHIVEVPKDPKTKYYPVIRAGLEISSQKSPFLFDSNKVCFSAQELIFNILKKAYYSKDPFVRYDAGTAPEDIFK